MSDTHDSRQLILLEHMQSQLQLVIERQEQFKTDILKEVDVRYNRLDEKIEVLNLAVRHNSRAIAANGEAIEANAQRIGSLEEKVECLDNKVEHLDRKVGCLDNKVDRLDSKFDGLAEQLTYHDREIEALKART